MVFIRNHYQDASGGASRQVAEFLSRYKVREVYAVKVGENARRHLDRLKIEFHQAESGLTVGQVMESIVKSGKD